MPTLLKDSLRELLQRLNAPRPYYHANWPPEIIHTLTNGQDRTNALPHCQDAQELFQLLSEYVKSEMTGVDQEGKRDRGLDGLLQNSETTKDICKSVFDGLTSTEGDMHFSLDSLQLSFPRNVGACRLEDCLAEQESLRDCVCQKYSLIASPPTMIAHPPLVLALHINRSMLYGGQCASKHSTRLVFPEILDITPYAISGYLSTKSTSFVFSPPPSTYNTLSRRSSTPTPSTHTSHLPTLYRLAAVVCHYGQHSSDHYICCRRKPRSSSLSKEKRWTPPKLVDPLLVHKESHGSCANGDVHPQSSRSRIHRDPSSGTPDSDCAQSYNYAWFLREGEDLPEAGRGWLRISDEAVKECGIEAV